jgi:hypothetical protein
MSDDTSACNRNSSGGSTSAVWSLMSTVPEWQLALRREIATRHP